MLIHNSDTAVKPIIGNKDIERAGELVFNAQLLPFQAWTAEEVSEKIETMQVENHLHDMILKTFDPEKADAIFAEEGETPSWLAELIE